MRFLTCGAHSTELSNSRHCTHIFAIARISRCTAQPKYIGPQMEPGSSRESPTGFGGPEPVDLREETPGEEAEDAESILKGRGGDGDDGGHESTVNKMKADCVDDRATEKKNDDEGEDCKYEEELDPRIQVDIYLIFDWHAILFDL